MIAPPAAAPTDHRYADIVYRWRQLSTCAAGIIPARLPLEAAPADLAPIADDLRILARKVDALIEAYGRYLDATASAIDMALFRDVLFSVIDGNALYEIERLSRQLHDDIAEQAYYARPG
jgi:hypothetical protein